MVRPSVSVSARLVEGWRLGWLAKDMEDRRDASLFFEVVLGCEFVGGGDCFVFFTAAADADALLVVVGFDCFVFFFLASTTFFSAASSNNQSILRALGSFPSVIFCRWLNNNSRTLDGGTFNRCARLAISS